MTRKLSGAALAAHNRKRASSSSSRKSTSREAGDTRGRYTADAVRRGFGGVITFGGTTAQDVAAELNALEGLGSMHPDEAGRQVQAAVARALYRDEDDPATRRARAGGMPVSIDQCIAAVLSMHAEQGFEGEQVGGPDTPVRTTEVQVPGGGTAAATGAGSAGPGAGAEPGAGS